MSEIIDMTRLLRRRRAARPDLALVIAAMRDQRSRLLRVDEDLTEAVRGAQQVIDAAKAQAADNARLVAQIDAALAILEGLARGGASA